MWEKFNAVTGQTSDHSDNERLPSLPGTNDKKVPPRSQHRVPPPPQPSSSAPSHLVRVILLSFKQILIIG
jgi:hypothetical protein